MLAQVCDMEVGELVHVIADAHIYDRHVPIIKELISRTPYPAPKFWLNPEIKDFYQFTRNDVRADDYVTRSRSGTSRSQFDDKRRIRMNQLQWVNWASCGNERGSCWCGFRQIIRCSDRRRPERLSCSEERRWIHFRGDSRSKTGIILSLSTGRHIREGCAG